MHFKLAWHQYFNGYHFVHNISTPALLHHSIEMCKWQKFHLGTKLFINGHGKMLMDRFGIGRVQTVLL